MLLALLLVGAASTATQSSEYDISTGNGFYALCTSSDAYDRVRCTSLLEGFVIGARVAYWEVGRRAKVDGDRLRSFCVPDEATNGQVRDVVVKHLRDIPAGRHMPTAVIVESALELAFPCPKPQK